MTKEPKVKKKKAPFYFNMEQFLANMDKEVLNELFRRHIHVTQHVYNRKDLLEGKASNDRIEAQLIELRRTKDDFYDLLLQYPYLYERLKSEMPSYLLLPFIREPEQT